VYIYRQCRNFRREIASIESFSSNSADPPFDESSLLRNLHKLPQEPQPPKAHQHPAATPVAHANSASYCNPSTQIRRDVQKMSMLLLLSFLTALRAFEGPIHSGSGQLGFQHCYSAWETCLGSSPRELDTVRLYPKREQIHGASPVCPNRTLIRTSMIVYCITEQNRADKEDIR
jgi:hypothetical protein